MEGRRKFKFGEVGLQICQNFFEKKSSKKIFDLNVLLNFIPNKTSIADTKHTHASTNETFSNKMRQFLETLIRIIRSVVKWIENLLLKRSTWVRFSVGSKQRSEKLAFTAFLIA